MHHDFVTFSHHIDVQNLLKTNKIIFLSFKCEKNLVLFLYRFKESNWNKIVYQKADKIKALWMVIQVIVLFILINILTKLVCNVFFLFWNKKVSRFQLHRFPWAYFQNSWTLYTIITCILLGEKETRGSRGKMIRTLNSAHKTLWIFKKLYSVPSLLVISYQCSSVATRYIQIKIKNKLL